MKRVDVAIFLHRLPRGHHALAEHLAARDGCGAPMWAETRALRQLWFPFNTQAARVDALVHAPAAFRKRGVYLAVQELGVA